MLRIKLALIAWIFVGLQCKPVASDSGVAAAGAAGDPLSCPANIEIQLQESVL